MNHLRTPFGLALLLIMTTTALTQPPPSGPGRFRIPPSVTLYSMMYLKDSGLRKELKISADQAAKLDPIVSFSPKAVADAELADRRADVIKKQDEAIAAVLTPAQVERLRQVVCQHLARIPAGPAGLASDEAIVRRLKLDDAQKKRLLARERLDDVLTADQKKTWTALIGKPYPARLLLAPTASLTHYAPSEVLFYFVEPIQQELKLTDKQIDQMTSALYRWADEFPDISYQQSEKVRVKLTKEVRDTLTPAQLKRGEQVLLQQMLNNTTTMGRYEHPSVAKVINLTAEQKEGQLKARRDYINEAMKLLSSGGDSYPLREKVMERRKAFADRLERELTDKQRADLKELLGETIPPRLLNPFVPFLPWSPRQPKPASYLVLSLLEYRGLAQNTGIVTAEQGKKLMDIKEESPPVDEVAESLKARAQKLEKQLAGILKPEQIQAWKQLVVRWHGLSSGSWSWEIEPKLLSCVDVAAELNLSEEQLKRFYRGAPLLELLDAKQKKKWEGLAGPPAKAPTPSLNPVSVVQSISILWMEMRYVGDPVLADELKLTPEQKTALTKLCKERRESHPKTTSANYYATAIKHLDESAVEVGKILDEKQKRRLRQVTIQNQGGSKNPGTWMLATNEVIKELKITPEQVKRISAVTHNESNLISLITQVTTDPANRFAKERDQAIADVQKWARTQLNEIVTAEQRKAIEELIGEPFKRRLYQYRMGCLP